MGEADQKLVLQEVQVDQEGVLIEIILQGVGLLIKVMMPQQTLIMKVVAVLVQVLQIHTQLVVMEQLFQ